MLSGLPRCALFRKYSSLLLLLETLQDTLVGCTFHFNHTLCFPKAVNLNKSGFLHERVVIVYVLTSHVMDLSFRRFSGTDQEGGSNDWDIRLWLLGDRLL